MNKLKGAYRSPENELNYLTFSQFKGLMKCQKTFIEEFEQKQAGTYREDSIPHALAQAFRMGTAVEAALAGGEQGLRDAFRDKEHFLWKKATEKDKNLHKKLLEAQEYNRLSEKHEGVLPDDILVLKESWDNLHFSTKTSYVNVLEKHRKTPIKKPVATRSPLWKDSLDYAKSLLAIPNVKWMVENMEHSAIMLSEFGDVHYKSETDFQSTDAMRANNKHIIVDLKTSKKPFEKKWVQRKGMKAQYGSFIDDLDYKLQAYIYRHSYLQNYGFMPEYYIVVLEKSDDKSVEIVDMNDTEDDKYYSKLLATYSESFQQMKMGIVAPQGCGKCGNCRSSKVPSFKDAIKPYELWN